MRPAQGTGEVSPAGEIPGPVLELEPMRRRHLAAVLRIEHRAHPKPWSLGVFYSELAQGPERHYVVLKADGKVVGYAGMMFVADEAHVTNIAVAPDLRRQGLGSRLLAHMVAYATRRGCAAMTLEVRASNLAAQELYHRFGFVTAGARRNYYPETHEDALIMWLYELGSPAVKQKMASIKEKL